MKDSSSVDNITTEATLRAQEMTLQALRKEFPEEAASSDVHLFEGHESRAIELMRRFSETLRFRASLRPRTEEGSAP